MERIMYNNVAEETAYLSTAIEINAAMGKQKVKISPVGDVVGLDGRRYRIDAQSVIDKSKERKIDIVLNVNHGWDSYGHKAAGWFDPESLEAREDGIYASVNLTDIGETLLGAKHYRYLSPEYHVARNGDSLEVLRIVGVGLVNRPNLLKDALNTQQDKGAREVKPDENEEQNETDKIAALEERVASLIEENKALRIDGAIKAKELMPSRRAFAMSLNGEQLDLFLETERKAMSALGSEIGTDDDTTQEPAQLNGAEAAVYKQLGITTLQGEEA